MNSLIPSTMSLVPGLPERPMGRGMGWATPSGPVTDTVFNELTASLIDGLLKQRPDGLLLALHGC